MSTTIIENTNIAAREHKTNPYPFYARLRAGKPVCPVTLPDKRTIWLVTRYDDVVTVPKDERFVKNPTNVALQFEVVKVPWVPRFDIGERLPAIDKHESRLATVL